MVSAPHVSALEDIHVHLIRISVVVGDKPFDKRRFTGRAEQLGYFISKVRQFFLKLLKGLASGELFQLGRSLRLV